MPTLTTETRPRLAFRTAMIMAAALACAGPSVAGVRLPARHPEAHRPLLRAFAGKRVAVQVLRFRGGRSVRIVRGGAVPRRPAPPRARTATVGDRTQIIRFGPRPGDRVTIVRGGSAAPRPARRYGDGSELNVEVVRFADLGLAPVTIVRERFAAPAPLAVDLFGPANGNELDRIAFAVDGIESRHGADLAMWRPELDGPQGPMQVSLAAATDVGGGDRFDPRQNRLIGRAYLAQMYRRYGDWPDALAAYNWGPANVDKWIAAGRDPAAMPPEVVWYIRRVLHDAAIQTAANW